MSDSELDQSLSRSKRILHYMMITNVIWIGSIAYHSFTNPESQIFGLTITGILAISFFWLFIQQKIINSAYLNLLKKSWKTIDLLNKHEEKEILDDLSKESTEVINSDDIPDITKLSKAKNDEELV